MSPSPQGVIAAALILPCFATIAVALRFSVRAVRKSHLMVDDWTTLFALTLTWALAILLIVGDGMGSFGGHTAIDPSTGEDDITNKEITAVKLELVYYLLMVVTFGVVKLSVLLLYRRIFVGPIFKKFSLGVCILVGIWSLAFFLAYAFECKTHITALWTSTEEIAEYCINTNAIDLGFGISDVLTDILVIAIPLPIILKLQMSAANKVGVGAAFMLGSLATAASIVRLVMVINYEYKTVAGYRDLKGVITNLVVWGLFEAGVAVVASCLPTLRPLFHGHGPESFFGSIRSKYFFGSYGSSQPRSGSDVEGYGSKKAILMSNGSSSKSKNIDVSVQSLNRSQDDLEPS